MAKSIEMRRRIRVLEAKRDKMQEMGAKSKSELAKVRAELKHLRSIA
jgi:hypothetical protein